MSITPLYAAPLGFLFIALSLRTVRVRGRLDIAIGDAGNADMLRAIRVHANFAEYVPLALLLIYLVEVRGGRPFFVHALCAALLAGRVAHAWGVSRTDEDLRFRMAGMVSTLTSIGVASGALLWGAFSGIA